VGALLWCLTSQRAQLLKWSPPNLQHNSCSASSSGAAFSRSLFLSPTSCPLLQIQQIPAVWDIFCCRNWFPMMNSFTFLKFCSLKSLDFVQFFFGGVKVTVSTDLFLFLLD
jgi:hypothetical protein